MARIAVGSVDEAPVVARSDGVETLAVIDGDDAPLLLHLHRLAAGATLRVEDPPADCLLYVLKGDAEAAGVSLACGSSAIVERGAALALKASGMAEVIAFRKREAPAGEAAGGKVRLLPAERVPRLSSFGSVTVGGALHADAEPPTAHVWLHEVDYPPNGEEKLHTHSADEIIFISKGEMRFGSRTYGPGTALAIPGDARYSFSYGDKGLSIANFRGDPSIYKVAGDRVGADEAQLWRGHLGRPQHLILDAPAG